MNLIHDVDNLIAVVGDIAAVQAMTSHAIRGFPVEDTAAVLFRFAAGAPVPRARWPCRACA